MVNATNGGRSASLYHHLATIRNTSALGLASLGLSLAPLDEPDLRGEPLGVLLGGPLGEARRLPC